MLGRGASSLGGGNRPDGDFEKDDRKKDDASFYPHVCSEITF
jgi:hypothetical protein